MHIWILGFQAQEWWEGEPDGHEQANQIELIMAIHVSYRSMVDVRLGSQRWMKVNSGKKNNYQEDQNDSIVVVSMRWQHAQKLIFLDSTYVVILEYRWG